MLLPRKLLVGVDYSAPCSEATSVAIDYARAFKASLHLVNAWYTPYAHSAIQASESTEAPQDHNLLTMLRQQSAEAMQRFVGEFDVSGLDIDWAIESGDPRQVLVHQAKAKHCDWLIVGQQGHTIVETWLLGSVANYLVRHSPIPVLVVPSGKERRT